MKNNYNEIKNMPIRQPKIEWPEGTKIEKTPDGKQIIDFSETKDGSIDADGDARMQIKRHVKKIHKKIEDEIIKKIEVNTGEERVEMVMGHEEAANKKFVNSIKAEEKNPNHKKNEIERRGRSELSI